MDVVLLGETINHVVLVLPDPGRQVAGDAHVERASTGTGQDVDAREFQRERWRDADLGDVEGG